MCLFHSLLLAHCKSYRGGSVVLVTYLCLLVTCVLCHCHKCLSWHRVMATTVSVIRAGLVITVTMTSMNVTRTPVATLAHVWIPSMGSIASVQRALQVWTGFMWRFKLLVLEVWGVRVVWSDAMLVHNWYPPIWGIILPAPSVAIRWRWSQNYSLKCEEPLNVRQSITSQKAQILLAPVPFLDVDVCVLHARMSCECQYIHHHYHHHEYCHHSKSNSQLLALVSFVFRDKILKHIHTH